MVELEQLATKFPVITACVGDPSLRPCYTQGYRQPCLTGYTNPPQCISRAPAGSFNCYNPNSTYGQASYCVFDSPSAGDPCVDDSDCSGGRSYLRNLYCDAAKHACLPNTNTTWCYSGAVL